MNATLGWFDYTIAYSPFPLIIIGSIGNLACFIILRTNKDLKYQSSMIIFSFISIHDTLSLFTWNINTYFNILYNTGYYYSSIVLCRLMTFIQYYGIISSALLLSFISIDRYIVISSKPGSFLSKLPFGTVKSSVVWSSLIIIFTFILNFHILVLNGYSNSSTYLNESIKPANLINCGTYKTNFKLSPSWNIVKLFLYSIIPTIIMIIFNSLIIKKTINLGKSLNQNDKRAIRLNKKKKNMTVSLLIITFMFLLLTLPNSIYFSCYLLIFNTLNNRAIGCLNFLTFLHHSTLFFSLYFTNNYFKNAVHGRFNCIPFKLKKYSTTQ